MQDTENRNNGISTDAQKMKSNGHINDNIDLNDEVDEGLAALKRQPSIKDRRRVSTASVIECLFRSMSKIPLNSIVHLVY